jgi:hypothetical protein
MQYIDTIPVFGTHEANTLEQAQQCARTADRFALMADGHLGYGVPIGGVIASESRISPTAVGFDIACGNKAVRLDMPGSELRANIHQLMDDIANTLSFGVGGLDESPHCYKRLPEVLAAHGSTIRILHTLTPLGVAMAGANEFDPYKD